MTNLQIQIMLEKAYKENFLDKILFLKEQETQYKKSSFFKQTKISLMELYKNFDIYTTQKLGLTYKIEDFINGTDFDKLGDEIISLLQNIVEDERFEGFLNKVIESFDFEIIKKQSEELDKVLKSMK
jgi:hypothetical protein